MVWQRQQWLEMNVLWTCLVLGGQELPHQLQFRLNVTIMHFISVLQMALYILLMFRANARKYSVLMVRDYIVCYIIKPETQLLS